MFPATSYTAMTGRTDGIAVLVRQDVPCQRMTELEIADIESVCLLCQKSKMPCSLSHVVIGAIYQPPSADNMAMTSHLLGCLDIVSRDHPCAGIVLLGDFNRLRDAARLSYPLKQVVEWNGHVG